MSQYTIANICCEKSKNLIEVCLSSSFFGSGSSVLYDVDCTGTEDNIFGYTYDRFGFCFLSRTASVLCQNESELAMRCVVQWNHSR